ncbi:membrane dipeptidase [Tangfeifania diversioriginum]|uniref:Membrane dipeptidase n=1 Tax=Tangfeifania diversioriginum TaxID=1168035 RepID=A0A1M6KKR9_9BACT|nr:dipeptidase [Tangfeifania diversioriginum]SHJ59533.1 membrane dipeptidase [Tangfeifania diversioriginum]
MFTKGLLLLITSTLFSIASPDGNPVSEKQVAEIHDKVLTVDTHVDTPMALLNDGFDIGERNEAPRSRVDFVRMKEGGLDAIFFAAFTGQRERTPENTEAAYKRANDMIDATYEVCNQYDEMTEVAFSSADADRIEAAGKRAIYIGMENGFPLGKDLSRVKEFYDRGVRYITLSHSSNNDICDSSTDRDGPEHNGLSDFGEEVVKEMNRLGMMIDVSHISDKSFYDVIQLSDAPVIASHSSVRAIAKHPRNMTLDMIKALAKNGGVIQICLLDDYVKDPDTTTVHYQKMQYLRKIYNDEFESMSDEKKEAFRDLWRKTQEKYPKELPTVADLVDHIDHVKNLVGIDYVGIGSDFDGGGGLADCEDVSQMPNITREMLRRGYTEDEIRKVWGGNFFRVFREVEELAAK